MKKEHDPITAYLPLDNARISELMKAAQLANVQKAKSLLYGVSPDVGDYTGRTALSWAASCDLSQVKAGHEASLEEFVQFILDRGANLDLGDHHGETPLHWAVKSGDHRVIDLFLRKGAHPDIADNRGRTPLSRAAERGYDQVVELIVATGKTDPDSKDGRGRTPLSWAAENWHLETVNILIAHGASVDIHDEEGQIPLWWFLNNTLKKGAIEQHPTGLHRDFQQWLAILGPNNGVEPMTKARRTFLSWACEKGDIQLVDHLLQTKWADPNSIDRYRKTPLIYAMEWNHYDVADLLISGHDDHQKRDIVSLRIMIQESRARLLKPFLERYKPSLEDEDDYSSIPLMRIALQQSDRATVTVLLEHKASILGLENGDWFGPCSTIKPTTDLMILNDSIKGGYSSIPVIDMAIPEVKRTTVAKLMAHRAKILDLEDEGINFRNRHSSKPSVAVSLVALRDGRRKVQWILDSALDEEIKELPKTSEEVHLVLFRENHRWNTYSHMNYLPNELKFSLGNRSRCRTFTLSIRMNLKMADDLPSSYNDGKHNYEDCSIRTIEWSVLEAPPKAIHYFSNLPYGWIPQSDLELVQLFMRTWREDWMTFCQDARRYMNRLRSHQLTARGKDDLLIDRVAENMLRWTHVQGTLGEQLSQARGFVSQYQRFSETRRFSEQMNETIDALDRDVSSQIDKLEQTVRDLLQIEFAWVSINEAHRSTSLATSMKRLSWITFVFLPLTFASSLFGMNVDILESNPTWRWYPLVGGALLLLTVIVWLSFKFLNIGTWFEHRTEGITPRTTMKRPIDNLGLRSRAWKH